MPLFHAFSHVNMVIKKKVKSMFALKLENENATNTTIKMMQKYKSRKRSFSESLPEKTH